MKWSIAQARQNFSEAIKAAQAEPQPIYNRDQLVAALVDANTFKTFTAWQTANASASVGAAFAELRLLCTDEGYRLATPVRKDRPNPFLEALDELSQ